MYSAIECYCISLQQKKTEKQKQKKLIFLLNAGKSLETENFSQNDTLPSMAIALSFCQCVQNWERVCVWVYVCADKA